MISRAKPLLGTLVTIQVHASSQDERALAAVESAFEVMAHVSCVMSAHDPDSDLGRMSRAVAGQVISVDAHTSAVLRASQYWHRLSAGAFDPVQAAQRLARQGARPGLKPASGGPLGLDGLTLLSATQLQMKGPLLIDLGGIAKGYAVDQAIEVLAQNGVTQALVNAGGDIRVLGDQGFAVEIRHAGNQLRDRLFRKVQGLKQAAMATSVAGHADTEFVRTLFGKRPAWRNATVLAQDCMTADVLTKWALQASLLCPRLKMVMRAHHAKMWRNGCIA